MSFIAAVGRAALRLFDFGWGSGTSAVSANDDNEQTAAAPANGSVENGQLNAHAEAAGQTGKEVLNVVSQENGGDARMVEAAEPPAQPPSSATAEDSTRGKQNITVEAIRLIPVREDGESGKKRRRGKVRAAGPGGRPEKRRATSGKQESEGADDDGQQADG